MSHHSRTKPSSEELWEDTWRIGEDEDEGLDIELDMVRKWPVGMRPKKTEWQKRMQAGEGEQQNDWTKAMTSALSAGKMEAM